jgi:hypothetical protein
MTTWQDYFNNYSNSMNTGKKNAFDSLDETQRQTMNQQAGMAGAAGLAGGGGRALGMQNKLAGEFGQQKAALGNQYDQQLAAAGMQAAENQMTRDQQRQQFDATMAYQKKKDKDSEPKWYDYLLGGVQTVGSLLPGIGGLFK